MNKRILSLLLCGVIAFSALFGFCACEKEENPAPVIPPPATPEYDGSAEDITTELSELSFTEAIGIFKDAIENSSDISSTLGRFKVEAEIPENMFSKKGKTYVDLADGVISLVNKEEEYYDSQATDEMGGRSPEKQTLRQGLDICQDSGSCRSVA